MTSVKTLAIHFLASDVCSVTARRIISLFVITSSLYFKYSFGYTSFLEVTISHKLLAAVSTNVISPAVAFLIAWTHSEMNLEAVSFDPDFLE